MLTPNSIQTRHLLLNRFDHAILSPENPILVTTDVVELKMRHIVHDVVARNEPIFNYMLGRLKYKGYYLPDIVTNFAEQLFDDWYSWSFIICLFAFTECVAKSEYKQMQQEGRGREYQCLLHAGYARHTAQLVDHVITTWIDDQGGWSAFYNEKIVTRFWIEKKILRRFCQLLFGRA